MGCEGDEGKPDLWHTFNAGGPHKTDVAVLERKGKKSDAVFNIIYLISAINEIIPNIYIYIYIYIFKKSS